MIILKEYNFGGLIRCWYPYFVLWSPKERARLILSSSISSNVQCCVLKNNNLVFIWSETGFDYMIIFYHFIWFILNLLEDSLRSYQLYFFNISFPLLTCFTMSASLLWTGYTLSLYTQLPKLFFLISLYQINHFELGM